MQACGILVSNQGLNLYSLQWKHRVLTNWSPGKSLGLWSILSWFLYIVLGESPISFFYMWMSNFSSTICWKDCPFLIELCWHPRQKSFDIYSRVYFWAFCSVSLFYMSVFMPVPYSFDCWRFVIKFEIRKCESSWFCSFSRLFWPLGGPLRFSIGLHWICRSIWEVLTLILLSLPIYDNMIGSHLYKSYLISFKQYLVVFIITCQMLFLHQLRWSCRFFVCLFILLVWYIILIGFCMLNHPWIVGTNLAWSWSLCWESDSMQSAPGAWLPATWLGWEMSGCYWAKNWDWLKLSQFTVQSCWKL